MINKKLLTVGSGLAVALSVAACNTDNLTNLNKNPNNPEDVPASTLFTAATVHAVSRWFGGYDLRATEFVTQHLDEVQYPNEHQYTRLTGGSTAGYLNNLYTLHLANYKKPIEQDLTDNQHRHYEPSLTT